MKGWVQQQQHKVTFFGCINCTKYRYKLSNKNSDENLLMLQRSWFCAKLSNLHGKKGQPRQRHHGQLQHATAATATEKTNKTKALGWNQCSGV